ncbi:mitochondrial 2-enoyl thioester reductase [Coemansia sp. S142-1]|nr:mitochondrial 2-enoyl thioester reductase [Coemansia sp. S142-1]
MLAAPVNPSDLNQIEGTYPVKGRFSIVEGERVAVGGNEGVGVVTAVGNGVCDFAVGDWVVPRRAGEFGTWCTHTVVGQEQVTKVPLEWRHNVDALTVGSMKVNPSTAYRLLRDYVDLVPGDWVIQNGANSGVGRAVIQMARAIGVRTINVVRDRSPEEYGLLERELRLLGADLVVRDTELSSDTFKTQVRALGAVKLGLNCVGGRMALSMTKHLSAGATLASYGGMSRQPVVMPTSLLLFKDIAARGFWMNRWYEHCGKEERDDMWREILEMAGQGRFVTQPMELAKWKDSLPLDEAQALVATAVAWGGAKHAFVFP